MDSVSHNMTGGYGLQSGMAIYLAQTGDKTVFYPEGEFRLQEKSVAFIFGERVVRPMLDFVAPVCRDMAHKVKKSLSRIDDAISGVFSFPGAEAKAPLPPNVLERIREFVGGVGNVKLTADMITRIIKDKQEESGERTQDIPKDVAGRIWACFCDAIDIAGVVVDPSEFAKYMVDELEAQAISGIKKIAEIKENYETQFDKPTSPQLSEQDNKRAEYQKQLNLIRDLALTKLTLFDQLSKKFYKFQEEIDQLDTDMAAKQATANGILAEAKGQGTKYGNIAGSYSSLNEKVQVGEKLKASLNEGIQRATYVLEKYAGVFEEGLTDRNFGRLPREDQENIAYARRRLAEQEAMLKTVESKLIVDHRSLDAYVSNGRAVGDSIHRLEKYLEEVVEDYQSLKSRKEVLEEEQVKTFQMTNAIMIECAELQNQYMSLEKQKDEL